MGQSTLTDVYSCATPCMRQQSRPPFRWSCSCHVREYFQKLCIWTGKGIPCFGRSRFPDLTLEPRKFSTLKPRDYAYIHTDRRSVFFFLHVAIRNSLRSNKSEHGEGTAKSGLLLCCIKPNTRDGGDPPLLRYTVVKPNARDGRELPPPAIKNEHEGTVESRPSPCLMQGLP